METPLLYRPEDAAELLGMKRSFIYLLIRSGKLPTVKLGRARRIPRSSLLEYIQSLSAEENKL